MDDGPRTVRAADRVLDLLLRLGTADALSLGQLAAATALSRSTAHRLLDSLERCGLAEYSPQTRTYSLGLRVLELASRRSRSMSLAILAYPALQRLRDATGETACVQVRSGAFRVALEQVESHHDVRRTFRIGEPIPIHVGAMGKLLLAFMPQPDLEAAYGGPQLPALRAAGVTDVGSLRDELSKIRAAGWATTTGERIPGARSIAGPLFGPRGDILAVIGVSGPDSRFTLQRARESVPSLLNACREVSSLLGAADSRPSPGTPSDVGLSARAPG